MTTAFEVQVAKTSWKVCACFRLSQVIGEPGSLYRPVSFLGLSNPALQGNRGR